MFDWVDFQKRNKNCLICRFLIEKLFISLNNFSILNVVVNIQIYIWIADEWLYKTSSNQNKDYLRIICLICSQRVSFYPKGFLSQFLLTGKLSVLTTFEMQNRWSGKGWTGKKYWGNSSLLPSPYVRAFRLV